MLFASAAEEVEVAAAAEGCKAGAYTRPLCGLTCVITLCGILGWF